MRNAEKETCELFFGNLDNLTVFILCLTIIELFNHGTHCLSFFSRVSIEYADERPCLVTAGQRWPDVYFCVWRRWLAKCRLKDGISNSWTSLLLTFRTFLIYQRSKTKCNNESFWSKLKKIFIWVQDVRRVDEAESTVGVIEYRLYQSNARHHSFGMEKDMKKQWCGGDRHGWKVLR